MSSTRKTFAPWAFSWRPSATTAVPPASWSAGPEHSSASAAVCPTTTLTSNPSGIKAPPAMRQGWLAWQTTLVETCCQNEIYMKMRHSKNEFFFSTPECIGPRWQRPQLREGGDLQLPSRLQGDGVLQRNVLRQPPRRFTLPRRPQNAKRLSEFAGAYYLKFVWHFHICG